MPRRILQGVVVSDKADKTITVLVERRVMHPLYKKYMKTSKKFAAHDEDNSAKIDDKVSIEECRPISKSKRWALVKGSTVEGKAPATAKKAAKPAATKTQKKTA